MQFKSLIQHLPSFSIVHFLSAILKSTKQTVKVSRPIAFMVLPMLGSLMFTANVRAEGEDIAALANQPGVYTLTNLHPDENRAKLYSANFQQSGLIPLCTEVEIFKVSHKQIKFKIKETGREYKYDLHRKSGEDLNTNAAKYFGTHCNKDKVAKLSDIDQKGIAQGKAMVGMSKQGVIYAIGYPPVSSTPTLDSTSWKYWFNRFNTFDVVFGENGKVTQVNN